MESNKMIKCMTPLLLLAMIATVQQQLQVVEAQPNNNNNNNNNNMSCGEVTSRLAPCFEFVLGGGNVPANCCVGVKSLYKDASTTSARRNVCSCLKSVTRTASPTAVKNAKSLPGKCGLLIPYEISPAIDCTKVK